MSELDPTADQWVVTDPTDAHDRAADAAGLTVRRDLFQLRRPLPVEDAERAVAEAAPTRRFMPGTGDESAWIAVNNRAFATHPDQGGFDPDRLRALVAEPWFDPDGFRLHHRAGRLAGFCWTKVHPADPARDEPALGEIFVIGVDPDFQGLGLGRALTLAGLVWLGDHGLHVGMLYVESTNTAARGLYGALGFEPHHTDRVYARQATPTAPPIR